MARSMPKSGPTNPAGPRRDDADLPPEISRDQWKRPLVVWALGEDPRAGTRASTLGGVLEDQNGIMRWKMGLAAYGTAVKPDLRLAIAAIANPTTPAGKSELYPLADAALEAADASAAARVGTAIHALSERVDRGEPLPELDAAETETLAAYAGLAEHFTMHAWEMFVAHVELEAAGTFDRLLSPKPGTTLTAPDGTVFTEHDRLIGDVKTSGTADYFGVKFAVQLAVYAGARPYVITVPAKGRTKARGEFRDWPDGVTPSQSWGLILHVPSGGSIAELYWVDLELGTEAAHVAKDVHQNWRKRRDLVLPATLPAEGVGVDAGAAEADVDPDALQGGPPPAEPDAPVADLEAARRSKIIRDAIEGAGSDAAMRALYARFREHWLPEHTELVKSRLAELGAS